MVLIACGIAGVNLVYSQKNGFTEYYNENLGLKLQYPSNWFVISEQKALILSDLYTEPFGVVFSMKQPTGEVIPSVIVFSANLASKDVTAEDLANVLIEEQKKQGGKIEITESGVKSMLRDTKGYYVKFNSDSNKPMKFFATFSISGEKGYGFIYYASPNEYDNYYPLANDILNSLSNNNNSSADSNPFIITNKTDNYANYFASVTLESVNLTRAYQNEIASWQLGQISNNTMVEITDQYLNNFTTQLNEFNLTESPNSFKNTKDSLVSSFSNEIKSYEFFRDYLISGNQTKNDLSTEYLSKALEDETKSFKLYQEVLNNTLSR
jgi:hypothetical protein